MTTRFLSDSGAAADLVQLVDFKWLMSGEGYRVDVQRLQQDLAYAHDRLALAAASRCQTLREVGQRIGQTLRVPQATP